MTGENYKICNQPWQAIVSLQDQRSGKWYQGFQLILFRLKKVYCILLFIDTQLLMPPKERQLTNLSIRKGSLPGAPPQLPFYLSKLDCIFRTTTKSRWNYLINVYHLKIIHHLYPRTLESYNDSCILHCSICFLNEKYFVGFGTLHIVFNLS